MADDSPLESIADLITLSAFMDNELKGVPAPLARRDLQQQSVVNGAEMAGERFKTILEVFERFDLDVDAAEIDRMAAVLGSHSGRETTARLVAEHLKTRSLDDAPEMNASKSPPGLEAAVNAINVGTAFTAGDLGAHLFLQKPTDPPAYYVGKWSVVTGMTFGGQTFWGRGVLRERDLILWQARISAMMTIEYYTSFVPTVEALEPWTAILWNEAPGAVGPIDRMPVSEEDRLKLLAGMGHMILLVEVLRRYPPAPPLPKINDVPLFGEGYRPTFGPFTQTPAEETP